MAIVPDTKDWTWVLERPCPECGYDAAAVAPADVAAGIRAGAPEWAALLERPRADLARRPADDVWSALEYACHVRDVLALGVERVALMRADDGVRFPNWDQDATAVERRYAEADPAVVAVELRAGAAALAAALDAVEGDAWGRRGLRSDGAAFTIASFARYLLHDPVHHLHDVRDGLGRIGAGGA